MNRNHHVSVSQYCIDVDITTFSVFSGDEFESIVPEDSDDTIACIFIEGFPVDDVTIVAVVKVVGRRG